LGGNHMGAWIGIALTLAKYRSCGTRAGRAATSMGSPQLSMTYGKKSVFDRFITSALGELILSLFLPVK